MNKTFIIGFALAFFCSSCQEGKVIAQAADGSVLPFPQVPSASIAKPRLQDSIHQRRVIPDRLPEDAPNIVIILM
ncbi:MAG TPA: hypothetical protein EYQ59_04190, partial [Planctomycetes bacterium]|nr:hypothetical protein [Planctomycetota bacterium]